MYEWETGINMRAIRNRMHTLRAECKRISNETLRGNFTSSEDRQYWVARLKELTGELSSLEQEYGGF